MGTTSLSDLRRADGGSYVLAPAPAPVCGPGEFAIAACGFEHGHIYGEIGSLCQAGATLKWVWDRNPEQLAQVARKYPQARVARSLDEMLSELNRKALKHKSARDNYHQQAAVLADKRNALQDKARKLVAEANLMKQRRDDYNLSAREAKEKREEWNDKVAMMRERGGLGDIGEARAQSQNYHQKVVKYSNSGQVAHEKMLQLRSDADKLREEAQTYHEK